MGAVAYPASSSGLDLRYEHDQMAASVVAHSLNHSLHRPGVVDLCPHVDDLTYEHCHHRINYYEAMVRQMKEEVQHEQLMQAQHPNQHQLEQVLHQISYYEAIIQQMKEEVQSDQIMQSQ